MVEVAFENKGLARQFINDLNPLNRHTERRVVRLVAMEKYTKALDDDDMIFEHHYHSRDHDSPAGSRDSVASSAQFLPVSNPVVQFQSIQPLEYGYGGGFEMCHIKSSCF